MADNPSSPLQALIADLRQQREKIDARIAMLESWNEDGTSQGSANAGIGGSAIGRHDFVGMTTPEAIKKFFKKKGGLHKPRDIAQALLDGGYDAADLNAAYVNVYSALKRTLNKDAVKLRGEWGSAEQYPNLVKKGAAAKGDDEEDDEGKEPAP